ncbi:Uma2 family endonuclease, partial [Nostoc sp. JL23]|uniref:Uma2 family endonuclease n=2 Tax=Nostoc TaxID=1177 RepID=UPI001E143EBB
MSVIITQPLTLEEFLKLPETKPASEYINGEIIQKPMPKGRHSRLQGKLCAVINEVTENQKIAYAFPELYHVRIITYDKSRDENDEL